MSTKETETAVVPATATTTTTTSTTTQLPVSPLIKMTNVVATYNFKSTIRLKDVAMRMANTEYSPKRFSAVIIRIRNPKATGLLFASGKMVCTGTKSKKESLTATRKLCKAICQIMNEETGKKASNDDTTSRTNLKYSKTNYKIQNMTCLTDFKFPIRLEGLAIQYQQMCTYEPEIFPGLIFRMQDPKVVLLIFVSGKVVITGAKKREDLTDAVDKIKASLHMFKKDSFVSNPILVQPQPKATQIADVPVTVTTTTTTNTTTTTKKKK